MKVNVIKITTTAEMDALYEDNSLTLEGLSEKSIPDFLNWIKETAGLNKAEAYITTGKQMNEYCGCTGSNRYDKDLTIVSVKLTDIADVDKIVMPRFQIGGRWYNDIVDNNRHRESVR